MTNPFIFVISPSRWTVAHGRLPAGHLDIPFQSLEIVKLERFSATIRGCGNLGLVGGKKAVAIQRLLLVGSRSRDMMINKFENEDFGGWGRDISFLKAFVLQSVRSSRHSFLKTFVPQDIRSSRYSFLKAPLALSRLSAAEHRVGYAPSTTITFCLS